MSNRILVRGAAALLVGGALAACTDKNANVLGPKPAQGGGIFQSYVALGNSITAGYQSAGINDSTQARSYAVLLAAQMGTRFAFPALSKPGCPPPIANFQTQARVVTTQVPVVNSTTCLLRSPTSATDILNNVAVPGATSFDPDAATTAASNLLTTLILGGKTQVRKALDASPTFATVWIGNNDVLAPALSGLPSTATPQTTFQTNYDKMLTDLSAPNLKGVLIGVVNVTSAPALFPVSLLINSVPFRTAFDQAAGFNAASTDPFKNQPLNIEANCTASQTTLVSFLIVPQIAAFRNDSTRAPTARTGHPPDISCGTSSIYPAPVGDVFILTPAEVTTLTNTVDGYNAYISGKATAVGWAYLNPNVILDSLKNRVTPSQITPGPNFASATQPFGKWISLDGVHPSSAAHQLITNYLIDVINGKYATSLAKLPNP